MPCGPTFVTPRVLIVDLFYFLASPFFVVYIFFKSRGFTRRRYRAGLAEKFGGVKTRQGDRSCLWIHAVSVGEVRTSLPLLRAILRDFSDWDVVLSTSTDTGHDVAANALRELDRPVELIYYPLDLSWAVRRTLRAIRPTAIVLIELELWPNFLMSAKLRDVPVLVANGRLTERSAKRYGSIPLGRFLFSLPRAFAAQDEIYAHRFRDLAVPGERVEVLGNLKFDIEIPGPAFDEHVNLTRDALGWTNAVDNGRAAILLAGCSHPGEESTILEIYRDMLSQDPDMRLILAPRHIERCGDVLDAARRAECGTVSRWSEVSETSAPSRDLRILVVDVIGELDRFYCLADLVFVGGTLIPHGGHNILEPARFGKPVVFGFSVDNFAQMVGHFLQRNAAVQVQDASDLASELDRLRSDVDARTELGLRARDASVELRGAVARHVEWMRRQLSTPAEREY